MPASNPSTLWRDTLRWLSWFHRWTGVAFCLAFVVWFFSGLVMVFVPFPSLSDHDRRAGSDALSLSSVRIDPEAALQTAGGGTDLRLIAVNGRNRYVIRKDDAQVVVDASSGQVVSSVSADEARSIAAAFGKTPVGAVSGPFTYDQWVVHQKFDPWRPFFRIDPDDAQTTQLYVSARTGEVVQRTHAWERGWNWIGSIPHWLYYTALRQSFTAWDWTMWSLALAALAGASVGTYLGIYRTYQRVAMRRPGWSPFKGLWRWHHGLGLGAALFVLTWIFSGWLSMDHGRLFSRGIPDARAAAIYAGKPLKEALQGFRASSLNGLQGGTELSFSVVGGHVVAVGRTGSSAHVAVLDGYASGGDAGNKLPVTVINAALQNAWPNAAAKLFADNDDLYRAADALPSDALCFGLASPHGSDIYIDAASGRPLLQLDTSRRVYDWVYFALHTSRFPGLVHHPTLRQVVQVIPLLLGLALSLTGAMLGFKRLRMSLPRKMAR